MTESSSTSFSIQATAKTHSVAIIPARGGSKRIRRKNMRDFNGKPMIAYSIEAALQSGVFDQVIVSTNDDEIANTAKQYGADIPFMRPESLSDDLTGTGPVIIHTIDFLKQQGITPDFVCCLYATVPMLKPRYIREGLELLQNNPERDFAFSVTEHRYPVQRSFYLREGVVTPLQPECLPMRSQDLESVYHDAGQFYWGKTESFVNNVPLFSAHALPIVLPHYLVQDVDTMDDWRRAEAMYRAFKELGEEGLC